MKPDHPFVEAYLGLDIGSSGLAAVAVDVVRGRVLARVACANDCETTAPADRLAGRSEWDLLAMCDRATELLRRLREALPERCTVEGIGVTGQQQGLQLCRDLNEPVGPFFSWQDQRAAEPMPGTTGSYLDRMQALGGEHFARCGCPVVTGYTAPTLFWLDHNGGVPPGARAATAPEFVVSRLSATPPVTDATDALPWGVFDVHDGRWHETLIDALGIEPSLLPEVVPSCTVAGPLAASAASACGIVAGTPVSVASGDHVCAFAATTSGYADTVSINIGTGGQCSVWVAEALERGGLDLRPFIQSGYLLAGVGVVGGRTLRNLRDFFARAGREIFGLEPDGDAVYDRLVALAAEVAPGSEGVTMSPLFTGTRTEPDLRASFEGIAPGTFTPGHFSRALMEAMAARLRAAYDEAVGLGAGARRRLVGSGNAVRRNPVLREALGTAFAMPLELSACADEAAVGAALCAAVATGAFTDIGDASRHFAGTATAPS